MTDKHPNQAVALAYWQDPTQEWRARVLPNGDWCDWVSTKEVQPQFHPEYEYELRPAAHKRPRRMRYVGGTLTFPEPMREAPKRAETYWYAEADGEPCDNTWAGDRMDRNRLTAGICQATEQGAKEQSAALAELRMEYVEDAPCTRKERNCEVPQEACRD